MGSIALAQFYKTCFQPLDERGVASNEQRLEGYYRGGEYLEAYWWLQLGVHIGYYPPQPSAQLIVDKFHLFLSQTVDVLEHWSNVFPVQLSISYRQIAGSQNVFPEVPGYEIRPDLELWPQFQAAFGLANSFAVAEGRVLLPSLTYANRQNWDELMQSTNVPEPNRMGELLKGAPAKHPAEQLYVDFFQTLNQMAAFDNLFRSSAAKRSVFEERIGLIMRWRLNFWRSTVDDRFMEVATRVDEIIRGEFSSRGWPVPVALREGAFLARVRQLRENWKMRGGSELMTASVGA